MYCPYRYPTCKKCDHRMNVHASKNDIPFHSNPPDDPAAIAKATSYGPEKARTISVATSIQRVYFGVTFTTILGRGNGLETNRYATSMREQGKRSYLKQPHTVSHRRHIQVRSDVLGQLRHVRLAKPAGHAFLAVVILIADSCVNISDSYEFRCGASCSTRYYVCGNGMVYTQPTTKRQETKAVLETKSLQ